MLLIVQEEIMTARIPERAWEDFEDETGDGDELKLADLLRMAEGLCKSTERDETGEAVLRWEE